ncbi:MAG: AAA family ATPase [Ruminococcus sp.]|nr:AAA family ATPase [Ruminococcus sp.]
MKRVLQYIWIEKYGCIEKKEYNFTNRVKLHFKHESGKFNIEKNNNYYKDFFGKNIELSCIVGRNGSGKTSLLEYLMHIMDGQVILNNCIIAFFDNDSLIVYHTGIIKDFNGEYKEFSKNEEGKYVIDNVIASDIVYYTYAFNFGQFNRQYMNVQNYSPAYLFKENSELFDNKKGDVVRLTDLNKAHNNVIHNQLDFVYKDKAFWKVFGIRKPNKIDVYIQNSRTNALLDFIDKYNENKKEAINQIERFSKLGIDDSEVYKSYFEECTKIESEFDIDGLCRNFFDFKSDNCLEIVVNNIAVELMNSFIEEINQTDPFFWNTMSSDSASFGFFRYLHSVYLRRDQNDKRYVSLKQVYNFFKGVKNSSFCSRYLYPIPPKADEEKWRMLNIEKYKNFSKYLLEFFEGSKQYIACNSNNHFSISFDIHNVDIIANPIRFYEEYFYISKVFNFLSFSYGLSSGEMALLNILSSIYKSISKRINPYKIKNESKNFIIMIDEADMLLHPEWQRKIIKALVDFLKQFSDRFTIQLLIATHSPIMLSDIPRQNVLYLESDFNVSEINQPETFGSNIFKLYNNAFFMDKGAIGAFAKEKLEILLKDILDGNGDKNDIQKRINLIGDDFLRSKFQAQFKSVYNTDLDSEIAALEKKLAELNQRRAKTMKENKPNEECEGYND